MASNVADCVQPAQFINYNIAGLSINNNNWVGFLFDLDSGTGNWKGAAAIAENTDGSATFWFFDRNEQGIGYSNVKFQFTWYAYNNNGAIDSGAAGSTQQAFVASSGAGSNFNGYTTSGINLINTFGNTTTQVYPSVDYVLINNYPVCRMRLYPVGGKGTQLHLANIYHTVTSSAGTSTFNDGVGNGYPLFTLQGPPPPPPPEPALISISPSSGVAGSFFTLTGTNISSADLVYLDTISNGSCPTVVNNSTTVTFQVPLTYSPDEYSAFLFDGLYSTNRISFTITAPVNNSPPSQPTPPPAPPAPPVAPYVTAITIDQLPNFTVVAGQSTTLSATIQYSDGSTQPLTEGSNWDPTDFVWAAANEDGKGTIGNSTAVFQGLVPGKVLVSVGLYAGGTNTVPGYTKYSYQFVSKTTAIVAQAPPVPPPPLSSLTIAPLNSSVLVNSTTQFTYYGTNTAGTTTYPPVAWSCSIPGANPGQGTIDTNAGLFSALSLPLGLSSVWWAGTSYPSNIPPSHNGALPQSPTTYNNSGNIPLNFSISGPSHFPSAIASAPCFYARFTGYIVAPTSGQYTIGTASSDGVNLYVNGNPIALNLAKIQALTSYSGTVNLTANAYTPIIIEWNCSNTSTGQLQLFWIPPGGNQVLIPQQYLQCDGGFNNNTYLVTCSALDGSGVTTSTDISIRGPAQPALPPSALTTIAITPASIALSAGSNQQFTALGYDEYSNPYPCTVTWGVNNINGSGIIDPDTGIFTAQIAGNDIIVTATTTDGTNLQAQATVIVTAGPLVRITVTPPSAILEAGNLVNQFTATGYDAYNNVVNLNKLVWNTAGGNGTITQSGLFTGSTAGLGKVIARSGSLIGTATTNVLALTGGLTILTYPQQPFARIQMRDTVNTPLVIDTRVRGGGLTVAAQNSQAVSLVDQFWWDLTSWEGEPFQSSGTYVALVNQPPIAGSIANQNMVQTIINNALAKFAAPQFFGIIDPNSLLMLTNYQGIGQSQLF